MLISEVTNKINTFQIFMRQEEKGTVLTENVSLLLKNSTFLDFRKTNLTRLTRVESKWAGNLDSQLCQFICNNLVMWLNK